jgi:two-component system CheB/CheR fusion protein
MTSKKKQPPTKNSVTSADNRGTEQAQSAQAAHFPIVGIGASAGGLAAFEAFFSGMPADKEPGMAFVLVQHLAPDHKSILTELIQRYTRMQVFEVEDGFRVQPNCVYIIPPNCDMAFLNGGLQLLEKTLPRGQRMSIDFFFRSLAQDQRELAIGIILSGTGSDGTLGLRAIKGEGGMAMAQSLESSEFDGMPQSAIETGLMDYVLPAAKMATQLMAYAVHAFGKPAQPSTVSDSTAENTLKKIFVILRAQTGHDFSQYKPSTINRRIERRMAVHHINKLTAYLKYLQQTPDEVEALFNDLLIGVTSFFRDPDAFAVLEDRIIPKLFADKPEGGIIRIWVCGCSSGEEAYSVAMLMQEHSETLAQSYRIQLFATDIDARAIASARQGFYPASIANDITAERLARFFTLDADTKTYRVHKQIRDLLIFSEQNVVKDPPFSRLDLICCRNLMIYMGISLQQKLIPLFHYALNEGGYLFLGTSETVGEFGNLFTTVERKQKLYQYKADSYVERRIGLATYTQPLPAREAVPAQPALLPPQTLQQVAEKALLQQVVQAGILINRQGDILYLYGRTGLYLEPATGGVSCYNVLKMAREGLRPELTVALHKAATSQEIVRRPDLRVKTNGDFSSVTLSVCPVASAATTSTEAALYMVVLEEASAPPEALDSAEQGQSPQSAAHAETLLAKLKQQLQDKEEYLQCAQEELESSNEELQSSNEELQSSNEELQSTNEELETSKEELQSVNEELATINAELQAKVLELSRLNNDMNNLLDGTGIGTVFLDLQLRILRFTPGALKIMPLLPNDVGRSVAHLASNLVNYDHFIPDLQAVLASLIPKEVEVQTAAGGRYLLRIRPYRTTDNRIEGAVVNFMDVTEIVQIRNALKQANDLNRLAVVVHDANDAVVLQDLHGRILAWNPAAVRIYGYTEEEALNLNIRELIPQELRKADIERVQQLGRAKDLEPYRTQRITQAGQVVDVWLTATAVINEDGLVYAIATTERTSVGAKQTPSASPAP